MSISSRIHDTIKAWTVEWKDQLRGWFLRSIGEGVTKFAEDLEPGAIDSYRAYLQKLIDNPNIPPELKEYYQKAISPGNILSIIGGMSTMILGSLGALLSGSVPVGNFMRYEQDLLLRSSRLDPLSAITAWRRDPNKYFGVFLDLKEQGWSDDRIEALKFITQYMPAPSQAIAWLAHEVFEPEMIAKYGLDSEFEGLDLTIPEKIGMSREMSLNEWRNHWQHASWIQIVEMLHRNLITEEDVYDWFRLVEIPPYWRDLLIKTAYTWPTRVDVRRWWDMRTIDEARLRELYEGMGYRGKNLDDYVLWTKVYTDFPSLMARWSKGWITEDDVRRELIALGMPAERVETMIQEKVKPEEAARVEEGKALTKTEIYKGVKQGFITREEGIELIMDLGYNRAEAEYLMDINVAVLAGSPETYEEFKDITTKYRIATGKAEKPMPEELQQAAKEVVRLTKEVEALEESIKEEEDKLLDTEILPAEATARRDELRVTRNRAIAELERAKSEYNSQLAEWRHRG